MGVTAIGVSSFNGRTGAVSLVAGDITPIDGAGSGIDADNVDGQAAAAFALSSCKTLGGVDSVFFGHPDASASASNIGDVVTGSNLHYYAASGTLTNAGLGGSWRCMGGAGPGGLLYDRQRVFVRIS